MIIKINLWKINYENVDLTELPKDIIQWRRLTGNDPLASGLSWGLTAAHRKTAACNKTLHSSSKLPGSCEYDNEPPVCKKG